MIFLGYPNWNANLSMPLYTFLDTYDLSGKNVVYSLVDFGRRGAWSGWGCPTMSHSPHGITCPIAKIGVDNMVLTKRRSMSYKRKEADAAVLSRCVRHLRSYSVLTVCFFPTFSILISEIVAEHQEF